MSKEIDTSKKALVSQNAANNFRENIKRQLIDHSKDFWANMSLLKPKDYCDVFLKMMPYGFAKVPDERPMDDETRAKLLYEETTRKATLISGGIPTVDADYEEEE